MKGPHGGNNSNPSGVKLWTTEMEDILRAEWPHDRWSASQIMQMIDAVKPPTFDRPLTRNSLIGKAYRMGLPARPRVQPQARKAEGGRLTKAEINKARNARRRALRAERAEWAQDAAHHKKGYNPFSRVRVSKYGAGRLATAPQDARPPMSDAEIDAVFESTGIKPKHMLDLDDFDCRWPMRDAFCGCKTTKRFGYCQMHERRSGRARNVGQGTSANITPRA